MSESTTSDPQFQAAEPESRSAGAANWAGDVEREVEVLRLLAPLLKALQQRRREGGAVTS